MINYKSKLLVAVVSVLMVFLHTSCINGSWVRGNGKVAEQNRNVATFSGISASSGMDVYLIQGEEESLRVEADENLMDIIITEVKGNTLFIKTSENIRRAKSRKVYVTFSNIKKIDASAGSDVVGKELITVDHLDLAVSSGANLKLWVKADEISCSVSSGADAFLRGEVDSFSGSASSGSDLHAKELKSQYCDARASSGGDVTVYAGKEITARASSGGDVTFYGNPESVEKDASSGGDVHSR